MQVFSQYFNIGLPFYGGRSKLTQLIIRERQRCVKGETCQSKMLTPEYTLYLCSFKSLLDSNVKYRGDKSKLNSTAVHGMKDHCTFVVHVTVASSE